MNRPTFRLRIRRLLERLFPLPTSPTLLRSYMQHYNRSARQLKS
jgi:hypothetical protein